MDKRWAICWKLEIQFTPCLGIRSSVCTRCASDLAFLCTHFQFFGFSSLSSAARGTTIITVHLSATRFQFLRHLREAPPTTRRLEYYYAQSKKQLYNDWLTSISTQLTKEGRRMWWIMRIFKKETKGITSFQLIGKELSRIHVEKFAVPPFLFPPKEAAVYCGCSSAV